MHEPMEEYLYEEAERRVIQKRKDRAITTGKISFYGLITIINFSASIDEKNALINQAYSVYKQLEDLGYTETDKYFLDLFTPEIKKQWVKSQSGKNEVPEVERNYRKKQPVQRAKSNNFGRGDDLTNSESDKEFLLRRKVKFAPSGENSRV